MATARNVFAQILPEVDQLQCRADGVALRQCLVIMYAVQMQQQAAHRVGGASAVVEQFCAVGIARLVAGLGNVLHEGAEQIVEQVYGQLPLLQLILQGGEDGGPAWLGGLALGNGMQFQSVVL